MIKKVLGSLLLSVLFPYSVWACPNDVISSPDVEYKSTPNDALAAPYHLFKAVEEFSQRETRLRPHFYRGIWDRLSENSRWALVDQLKQKYPQYKRERLYYFLGNAVQQPFVQDFWQTWAQWLSTPAFDVFADTNGIGAFEVIDFHGSEATILLKQGGQEIKAYHRAGNHPPKHPFWTLGLIESLLPELVTDERCEGGPEDSDLSSYDNPHNHQERYQNNGQLQDLVGTGKVQRRRAAYNPANHLLMLLRSETLGNNSDIYALDPQTGKSHRLTWFENDPRYGQLYDFSLYPRWSADRQQIAFVMNDEIYTIRYDGTQLKRRMDRNAYNESVKGVDWLGSDLIFASEVKDPPESLQGNAHYTAPIFLFRLNLQAQTREQIPFSLNEGDILLKKVYVHKNRILTEHKRRNPLSYTEWFERNTQGAQVRKMALPAHNLIEDVQLSPDGQSILYHKRLTKAEADKLKKGKNCVWHVDEFLCESAPFIAKANGSNPKQLFPAGEAYYSVWSQDGKKIYHLQYVHPDKGQDFVFETRSDGGGRRKVYQAPPGQRLRFIWP